MTGKCVFARFFIEPVEGGLMKINWSQIGLIAGVALAVVYASNNDLPIIGNSLRKAVNGGKGLI